MRQAISLTFSANIPDSCLHAAYRLAILYVPLLTDINAANVRGLIGPVAVVIALTDLNNQKITIGPTRINGVIIVINNINMA